MIELLVVYELEKPENLLEENQKTADWVLGVI